MPKVSKNQHPNRMPPGVAHPIDVHVGGRVRQRRKLMGMSQGELGDLLGLTFQQIQKYERGANRIGASRLYLLSQILNVPISFFFDAMSDEVEVDPELVQPPIPYEEDPRDDPEMMGSEETTELITAYYSIDNSKKRKAVHDLIASLSKASKGDDVEYADD